MSGRQRSISSRAKASGASADVQLDMNKQIRVLERSIEEGKGEADRACRGLVKDAWGSIKDGVESAWDSLKSCGYRPLPQSSKNEVWVTRGLAHE